MAKEVWKDIPEYEGLYQVSNTGKVFSVRRNKEMRFRKITSNVGYYYWIRLVKNKRIVTWSVHRLVMLAFVGPSGLEVNHKDCNKLNNNLYNLEYCTHSENIRHAHLNNIMNMKKGEDHYEGKLTNKKVIRIRKLRKKGADLKYLSEKYKVSKSLVSQICLNKKWKHI